MNKFLAILFPVLLFYSCQGQNNDQDSNARTKDKIIKTNTDTLITNFPVDSLVAFLKEEKFNPGAAGWEGYSGAHDAKIKSTLSAIVNGAISDFITLIKEKKTTSKDFYISGHKHWKKLIDIQLELDTDESEVTYMYFDNLFRLVGLVFDEEEISNYK